MVQPLMPKATAVWLVDHTALTFDQISEFCGLHTLEVQAIADGEVAPGMQGLDPTVNRQLTKEEIIRCEGLSSARLEMSKPSVPLPKARQKGARYTPISKRQDRPDAIAWLLRTHPELSDAQISRLIGTTKPTINSVRNKTHRNTPNITPQSPVYLGLCSATDLEKIVIIARARARTQHATSDQSPALDAVTDETPPDAEPSAALEPDLRNSNSTTQKSEVSTPSPWNKAPTISSPSVPEKTPTASDIFGTKPPDATPDS